MIVIVAGCAAFRHREYLQPVALQVHLHLRRHGRRFHGSFVHQVTSLPNRLDHLGCEACFACQRRDPGARWSVMVPVKLSRTKAHREKASISTLVVVSSLVLTPICRHGGLLKWVAGRLRGGIWGWNGEGWLGRDVPLRMPGSSLDVVVFARLTFPLSEPTSGQ